MRLSVLVLLSQVVYAARVQNTLASQSPSASKILAHPVSATGPSNVQAVNFEDQKERNVGNTPYLELTPIAPTFTYKYHCPYRKENQWQTFAVYIKWLARQRAVQFLNLTDMGELFSLTMHGTYPYWSTAMFEHRKCVVDKLTACSYYFKGQIYARVADDLTAAAVWNLGEGYMQPLVTEHCVFGKVCDTSSHSECTLENVRTDYGGIPH